MEFVDELWPAILTGGVAVFFVQALVWMILPHHKSEWRKLHNEDEVLDALRAGQPAAGLYAFPYMADPKEAERADVKAKLARGPMGFLTIAPAGPRAMGPMMIQSLLSNIGIAFVLAYLAFAVLPIAAPYLKVFRVVGTAAFASYAFASIPEHIWFARPWKSWLLQAFDALLYALIIAGIFGWLWPK